VPPGRTRPPPLLDKALARSGRHRDAKADERDALGGGVGRIPQVAALQEAVQSAAVRASFPSIDGLDRGSESQRRSGGTQMRSGARRTTGARTRRRLAAALALSVLAIAMVAPPASAGGQNDGEIFYLCYRKGRTRISHRLVETWRPCKASDDNGLYWTPVLLRDGARVRPHKSHIYLRNGTSVTPVAFPSGFDYVWGKPGATSRQRNWSTHLFWQCGDTSASRHYATPPNCPNADNGEGETALTLIVRFGQCWDGMKLTRPSGGECPSGTRIFPKLEIHIQYTVPDAGSSRMSLSNGSIYGIYGGFRNGWAPATLQTHIDECIAKGTSCHLSS